MEELFLGLRVISMYLVVFFSTFILCEGDTVLEYVGCYRDGNPRELAYASTQTPTMTPSLCVRRCTTFGYLFAGVQNGNQCWCGNTLGKYGRLPESECANPCPSYTVAYCGKGWANAMYRTKGYELGCYEAKDSTSSVHTVMDDQMTSHVCVSECFKQNYRYAALKDAATCQCFSSIDRISHRRVDSGECQSACAGDSTLTCGNNGTWSLYDLSLDAGDYAAAVQSCTASSEHPGNFACGGAFDGVALVDHLWASHGQGTGTWIQVQFDRPYILKGLQALQRWDHREQSEDIRLVFESGHMNFTLQHRVTDGYLWDYLDISPQVLTSSVRVDILTVYTQVNNGFMELSFVTNNDLLAVGDLSREPETNIMVDDSNTTCFGFEDRKDKTLARPVGVDLIAFNQIQSSIQVSFDRNVSCFESLSNQVMISAMYSNTPDCPYHRQCDIMSEGITDNTWAVTCLCNYSPCEIHVLFKPSSTVKICNMRIN